MTPPAESTGPRATGPRRPRGRPPKKMTDHAKAYLASAVASGEAKKDIAEVLHVRAETISRAMKDPEVQEMVAQFRRQHRLQNLEGAVGVVQKVWGRIGESLDAADPKTFDLYTRGALNMERIAASASGELKPGPAVTIVNQQANLQAEGQELIAALLAGRK